MNLTDAFGLSTLTKFRETCYTASHDPARSSDTKVCYWLGHKVVVLCSLGCNLVAATIGLGLTAGSALTLGSAKIFIYAITGGNIQPAFPSGFVYFGEFTLRSNLECFAATWDLIADSCYLGYEGYKAVKWTFDALNLTQLFTRILNQLEHAAEYTLMQLAIGGNAAIKDEEGLTYEGYPVLKQLDNLASPTRTLYGEHTRSFADIGLHTLLSIPSIPLHLMASVCSGIAASILTGAFIAKVVIHAATGLHIPVPTGAPYAIHAASDTGLTVLKDASVDFADVFVTIYKTADLLRITTVVAKIFDLLVYIPVAIFS